MKRIPALIFAAVLAVALHAASAYPWLGTITSLDGGAFNNTNSKGTSIDGGSRTFTIGFGLKSLVGCDVASCVQSFNDAGISVTCASGSPFSGIVIQAGQLFPLPLDSTSNIISIIPVTPGADNCNVFQYITQ